MSVYLLQNLFNIGVKSINKPPLKFFISNGKQPFREVITGLNYFIPFDGIKKPLSPPGETN